MNRSNCIGGFGELEFVVFNTPCVCRTVANDPIVGAAAAEALIFVWVVTTVEVDAGGKVDGTPAVVDVAVVSGTEVGCAGFLASRFAALAC